MSFSWLLPRDGFQFNFLLHDSENDLYSETSSYSHLCLTYHLGIVHGKGGGGYIRNFWVGMSRWDPGTLNLYQS